MTYRPAGSVSFGPPLRERWATLLYVGVALLICGVILYGQNASSNSWIFRYVVEGDRSRLISSSACAVILGVSAAAALAREGMRGVVVHPDGIEMRELLSLGWPRVRRFQWQQIDRMFLPSAKPEAGAARKTIRVDLWDGSRTRLPPVGNWVDLAVMLEKVALARAIPVEGGTGLVDDFLVDDEQEADG
jgi:hypothetical protein